MGARPAEGPIVACHGHGEEADGYCAGFGWGEGEGVLAVVCGAWEVGGEERWSKWERRGGWGVAYLSLPLWMLVWGGCGKGDGGDGWFLLLVRRFTQGRRRAENALAASRRTLVISTREGTWIADSTTYVCSWREGRQHLGFAELGKWRWQGLSSPVPVPNHWVYSQPSDTESRPLILQK